MLISRWSPATGGEVSVILSLGKEKNPMVDAVTKDLIILYSKFVLVRIWLPESPVSFQFALHFLFFGSSTIS